MNPGWHVYVEGERRGDGDVVEVTPDRAAELVARGVAVEVDGKVKASGAGETSDAPKASDKGKARRGDPPAK